MRLLSVNRSVLMVVSKRVEVIETYSVGILIVDTVAFLSTVSKMRHTFRVYIYIYIFPDPSVSKVASLCVATTALRRRRPWDSAVRA